MGEYDKAIADHTEAIRQHPSYAEVYLNRGAAHALKGEWDEAVADFTEDIRLRPDGARSFSNRGNAYLVRGEYQKAVEDLTEAIRLAPGVGQIYRCWAQAYARRKQYDKALADCEEAFRLAPEDPDGWDTLTALLAACPKDDLRDGKRAVELTRKACESSGWSNYQYLDTLAAAHAECGNFAQAVKLQKKVVKLVEGNQAWVENAQKRLKL
jgi:tetratricopeptide (TPR) repeat protein